MSKSPEKYSRQRKSFRRLLAITGSAAMILPPAVHAEGQPQLKTVSQKQNKQAGAAVSRLVRRTAALSSAVRGVSSTDSATGNKLARVTYIANAPIMPAAPGRAAKAQTEYIFDESVPITPKGQIIAEQVQSLSIIKLTTEDTATGTPSNQVDLLFKRDPRTHRWAVGETDTSGDELISHVGLSEMVHKANLIVDEAAAIHKPAQPLPPSK